MFRKILVTTLLVLVAISAAACGQLSLPQSFGQPVTDEQTTIAPVPAPGNAPDQAAQSAPPAPGSGPQAGPGVGNAPGGILEMFRRLGWAGGVVTKISDNQIALRMLPAALGQNPPGPNQRGQNQPGVKPPGQTQPNPNQPSPNAPNQRGKDQIVTVAVNTSTIFVVPGKTGATLGDIHVGDRIIVDAPRGQKTAGLVLSMPKQADKDNVALGMVQTNANGTLTLRTRGGGDTVTTTAATQVFKLARDSVTPGAVNDLQMGALIVALGKGDDDEFAAQVIFALPKGVLDQINPPGNKDRKTPQQQQPPAQNQGR